jgi:hypothetical protein
MSGAEGAVSGGCTEINHVEGIGQVMQMQSNKDIEHGNPALSRSTSTSSQKTC